MAPPSDSGLTGLPAKQDAGSGGGVDGDTRIESKKLRNRGKIR